MSGNARRWTERETATRPEKLSKNFESSNFCIQKKVKRGTGTNLYCLSCMLPCWASCPALQRTFCKFKATDLSMARIRMIANYVGSNLPPNARLLGVLQEVEMSVQSLLPCQLPIESSPSKILAA